MSRSESQNAVAAASHSGAPSAQATPRVAGGGVIRAMRRLIETFAAHRCIVVDGVKYRELDHEPLTRSLSRTGRGYKDYIAINEHGSRRRIRVTPKRPVADLAAVPSAARYGAAADRIRPGWRILELGCGTGFGSQHLAVATGPFGAVVAMDSDEEAVLFASWRYPRPNVSYELLRPDSLVGETDGAFDAVVWIHAPGSPALSEDVLVALLREAWRLVRPGGEIVLSAEGFARLGVESLELEGMQILPIDSINPEDVVLRKADA